MNEKMPLAVSREICHRLSWHKLNGDLKDMSCRVAPLRMQEDGLIELPPLGRCNASGLHVIAPAIPAIVFLNSY